MKAIVQDSYGPPEEVLKLREIDAPVVGDDEVLVRVRAASVHPDVWHEKMEMIRGLGADQVIDYTQEDFTRRAERHDLIFDVASNLSLRACRRALKPAGTHILIGHDQFGNAAGRVLGSVPRVITP